MADVPAEEADARLAHLRPEDLRIDLSRADHDPRIFDSRLTQQKFRVAAYWVDPWPSFREIAQKSLNEDHTARLVWCVRRSQQNWSMR
jgi:hypothetical protein